MGGFYDILLANKLNGGGGGSSITVESLSVSANGIYSAPTGKAYDPVTVAVPQPSGTINITENGEVNVASYSLASVSVPTFTPVGTLSITSNGVYDVGSFASADVNVSGGGEDFLGKRLDNTLIQYTNSTTTTIPSYAFISNTNLESVVFGACTTIGTSAFSGCTKLAYISFPVCTSIKQTAFVNCTSLTILNFPECTKVNPSAFSGCGNVTSISFPKCTTIENAGFSGCYNLTQAVLPSCTSIAGNGFRSCTSLAMISLPLVESIGTSAFASCRYLESAYIGLEYSSVPYLATGVFVGTGMSISTYIGHFGSIYVPASLVDAYKSATNWIAYADRITSYVA